MLINDCTEDDYKLIAFVYKRLRDLELDTDFQPDEKRINLGEDFNPGKVATLLKNLSAWHPTLTFDEEGIF